MELKTYRLPLRIWHWLNAIAITGLLGTVLLRKTFLGYKSNAALIQGELSKLNIDITNDAAKVIGKAIRAPMWEWHYVFGFLLGGLFVYRVVLHFIDRPFLEFEEIKKKSGSHKIVEYLYGVQYLLLMMMVFSGGILYFRESLHIAKDLSGIIKEAHEVIMYFFAFFVPAHVAGAFLAENRDQKGIVSNMIGGKG
jgi:cytochrome b561